MPRHRRPVRLHHVDEKALFEGAERWVRGGADGTPMIGEFIAAEIAGILGVSIGAAVEQIATVLNLRHRHPALWCSILDGSVRVWQARVVAQACDNADLPLAACLQLDRHCAVALAQQPFGRVMRQLQGWIILADPARAAERERQAAARRHVSLGHAKDGNVPLWAQLDAADGLALDEALSGIADALPHTHRDVSRAAALGIMARHALGQEALPLPGHDPACAPSLPRRPVEITVQLAEPATPDTTHASPTTVADVRGWGHLSIGRLATAFAGSKVTIRPILNTTHIDAVDSYQVPTRMRAALEARFPVDAFPYGTRDSHTCDADHTTAFDHHNKTGTGQTRLGNLAPLSRFTHRLKTHGGWHVEQPQPGVLLWTSPLGYHYLVTPDGTTMIDRPPPGRKDWWQVEPLAPDAEPPGLVNRPHRLDPEPPELGGHPSRSDSPPDHALRFIDGPIAEHLPIPLVTPSFA